MVVIIGDVYPVRDLGTVWEELGLRNSQLKGHHIQKFPFHPRDIVGGEHLSAGSPMCILQGGVIGVFRSDDKGTEEDALTGPFLKGNAEVRLGTLDVSDGHEDGGEGNISIGEDAGGEVSEGG
jgi:hypothetical protein